MSDFAIDLKKYLSLYRERSEEVCRKTVLELGKSLVLKSPVGDPVLWKNPPPPGYVGGHFRRNWQYGTNIAPSGEISGVDPTGEATLADLAMRVSQAEPFAVHCIANNLPYGPALEFDGHSTQAPAGMVGITAAEFEQHVATAVDYAKRKTA